MSATVARLLYIPSLIASVVLVIIFARKPLTVEDPAALASFSSEDKSITVSHPSNWRAKSNSIQGQMTEVWFDPARDAKFYVSADLAGSLMADISKGPSLGGLGDVDLPGGGAVQSRPENRALNSVHELKAQEMAELTKGWEESGTRDLQIAGLEARISDISYPQKALWGSRKIVGKRATVIANDRRIHLVYRCPEDLKEKLFPVFDQMVASLRYQAVN